MGWLFVPHMCYVHAHEHAMPRMRAIRRGSAQRSTETILPTMPPTRECTPREGSDRIEGTAQVQDGENLESRRLLASSRRPASISSSLSLHVRACEGNGDSNRQEAPTTGVRASSERNQDGQPHREPGIDDEIGPLKTDQECEACSVLAFAQGLVASNSDCGSPLATNIGAWVMSSGTPSLRPLSWRGWRTRAWIERLSGTILRPSTASRGVERWISSLRASRVSHSPQPVSNEESMTSAGSGRTSPASSGTWIQESFFWRTCLDSCATGCESCGRIFDAWVSGFGQASSRRQKLVRRTGGSGSSSWPTATEGDSKASGSRALPGTRAHTGTNLTDAVGSWARGMYPTPSAQAYGSSQNEGQVKHKRPSAGTMSLETWARRRGIPVSSHSSEETSPVPSQHHGGMKTSENTYPTPTANNDKGAQQRPTSARRGRRLQDGPGTGMALNPQFVEWLMGLPIGWTGCAFSATEWSLWLRRMRSELWPA